MTRRPITAALILASLHGWREEIADALADPDLLSVRVRLLHLHKALEQAQVLIADAADPEDPIR